MKKLILASVLFLISSSAFATSSFSFNIESMFQAVFLLVIVGLIFWAVWWFIAFVGVPEPFNKIIQVVMGLIALLIVLSILFGMLGHPVFNFR